MPASVRFDRSHAFAGPAIWPAPPVTTTETGNETSGATATFGTSVSRSTKVPTRSAYAVPRRST